MKPTIAIVVPGLTNGGGVPAVAAFLLGVVLRSNRYRLRMVSLSTGRAEPVNSRITSPHSWLKGPAVQHGQWEGNSYCHVGNWFGELEFQRYGRRRALTDVVKDADLIQVVSGFPAWANSVLDLGIPVSLQVATLAAVELRSRVVRPSNLRDFVQRTMLPVTSALDERALRKVDALQVENPWMLEHARRSCAGTEVDIKFAPPGIDTTIFSPSGKSPSKEGRYILLVGRLDDPRKRAGLLLEAYALLPNELRSAVRLQLAGSCSPGSEFWQRVEQLGLSDRVSHVLRPSLTELVELYREADVFALPSDEEGLGLVVLEAMACGTPVVATRCGGPEGIIEDGVDGYLVPRDNPRVMSERLQMLLKDDSSAQEISRRARQKAVAKYDIKPTGEVFLEIWDRLLR